MKLFRPNFRKNTNQIPESLNSLDSNELMLNPRIEIKLMPNYWDVIEENNWKSPGDYTTRFVLDGEYILDSSDPHFLTNNISPLSRDTWSFLSKGADIIVKGKPYEVLDVLFAIGNSIKIHWDSTECNGKNIPFYMQVRIIVKEKAS
jgi:hypothetical protein